MQVYNHQPESAIDSSHAVAYSCAAEPARQCLLMPKEEQLGAALHAAAASVGQAANVLHVSSCLLTCSALGPILFLWTSYWQSTATLEIDSAIARAPFTAAASILS